MPARSIIQSSQTGGGSAEDRILKSACSDVVTFDDALLDLITDLLDTMMYHHNLCVGLAAPQIGIGKRVAVILVSDTEKLVLINPEITRVSGKKDVKRESCMSIWGLTGSVERRDKTAVRFQDIDGSVVEREFSGFPARIVAHEVDHLNGFLYSWHVSGPLIPTDIFDERSPVVDDSQRGNS